MKFIPTLIDVSAHHGKKYDWFNPLHDNMQQPREDGGEGGGGVSQGERTARGSINQGETDSEGNAQLGDCEQSVIQRK